MQPGISILWTIIIGLGASIIGGILVMRKTTYDNKRLYSRQMSADFEVMSELFLFNARSYLELLDYDVKDFNANKTTMDEKANLEIVNRVRKEYESKYEKGLEEYDIQKLVSQVDSLVKEITHETTGFRNFFNKYPLQASYFDSLYQVSSAVETIVFFESSIPTSVNDGQKRICVSNITSYLLDALVGLIIAGLEIKYYRKAKAWTWRLIIPTIRA